MPASLPLRFGPCNGRLYQTFASLLFLLLEPRGLSDLMYDMFRMLQYDCKNGNHFKVADWCKKVPDIPARALCSRAVSEHERFIIVEIRHALAMLYRRTHLIVCNAFGDGTPLINTVLQ